MASCLKCFIAVFKTGTGCFFSPARCQVSLGGDYSGDRPDPGMSMELVFINFPPELERYILQRIDQLQPLGSTAGKKSLPRPALVVHRGTRNSDFSPNSPRSKNPQSRSLRLAIDARIGFSQSTGYVPVSTRLVGFLVKATCHTTFASSGVLGLSGTCTSKNSHFPLITPAWSPLIGVTYFVHDQRTLVVQTARKIYRSGLASVGGPEFWFDPNSFSWIEKPPFVSSTVFRGASIAVAHVNIVNILITGKITSPGAESKIEFELVGFHFFWLWLPANESNLNWNRGPLNGFPDARLTPYGGVTPRILAPAPPSGMKEMSNRSNQCSKILSARKVEYAKSNGSTWDVTGLLTEVEP
ncbi:hypothetical protein FB45DRAFT_871379 [Roridomyces roridus]|uniref:Uncharacterized protein n=1 Tax=Roridomyces roridus TaxID=1738132 RepID=A0AAD7BGE6_9AGAR|nr:hypothetical protein FB45DRAFT_871379 [Roridomyces roridus]